MARTGNEILTSLDRGITGYRVFYIEDSGNSTYIQGVDWQSEGSLSDPKFFSIYNTGSADLTMEVNDDGMLMTVSSGKSIGEIGILPYISKVNILATDSFRILLSK